MMTMAEIKMTIAEKLEIIATEMSGYTFEDGVTIEEFVADRKAKLVKKRSGSSKKSKENKEIADRILDFLEEQSEPITLNEIQDSVNGCKDYSTSKMAMIVKILVDNGSVEKKIKKRIRYYGVPSVFNTETE